MVNRLHPLKSHTPEPKHFTNPFDYIPHPLCTLAAAEVQQWLKEKESLRDEINEGKMFGILVVKDCKGSLGFLAAYSGLLGGRNDWEYFVPPIYDCLHHDGYFKQHEREISKINILIDEIQNSQSATILHNTYNKEKEAAEEDIGRFKAYMAESKKKRHGLRSATPRPSDEELAALVAESQFQKAELKRMKQQAAEKLQPLATEIDKLDARIAELKRKRKEMSDKLQQWLFRQYDILNAEGEHTDLYHIFANTPQGVPPSGAGDCCAPKLLQYAFIKGYRPICMAEFWWGKSPKAEIRHHLHYYPACRSKCKPILSFMLKGLDIDKAPHSSTTDKNKQDSLRIVFEDEDIIVISKPAGMLSVPGLIDNPSVIDILHKERGKDNFIVAAHRLDMATSGLLLVAKNKEALCSLHKQFANHEIKKRYVAILDGVPKCTAKGNINLPIAPDPHDSPRQIVTPTGKPAETHYEIVQVKEGKTLINLYPRTGRTHQLRIHCAHRQGLGIPILGDKLYGHPTSERMFLHAAQISFKHPITGQRMMFEDLVNWF